MEVNAAEEITLRQHYSFDQIYESVKIAKYPENVKNKGDKTNFRHATKPFCVINGMLIYLKRKKDGSVSEVRGSFVRYLYRLIDWRY